MKISSELRKLIENNPMAFATSDKKGKPNVVGIAFCKVVASNQILITDNYMNKTKKNILKNSKAALAVWDKKWNGYQMKGVVKYYSKGKWADKIKKMKENKGMPCKGAVVFKVNEVFKLA